MLAPISAEWVCAVQRGRIHAAKTPSAMRCFKAKRKTVDTLCGYRRAMPYAAGAVNGDGADLGAMVLPWPPPVRHDGRERCNACWDQTGRQRPHRTFRTLRQADVLTKEGR